MSVNQYVPKYIDCKIIKKKDNGDTAFLEKDHLNSVEDSWLQHDTKIGQNIIQSGTSLIDIINKVADECAEGRSKIDSISVNHITQPISPTKNVDITVPTDLSQLNQDATHRIVTDGEKTIWNGKQNTIVWQSDNYDPINNKAVTKQDIDQAIAPFASATRWRGVFNSLNDVPNPQNGDVVAVGYKEYIYSTLQEPVGWRELGDENSYIHKGEVTNSDIKDNAAISQSKIAGLVDALSEKVVKEVGKSLVLDTEIAKIHSHDNKTTLDNITQTAWDTVVSNSNEVPHKVDKTTTIAGVNLQDNITKEELLTALDDPEHNILESVTINGNTPTISDKNQSFTLLSNSPFPASFVDGINPLSDTVTTLQFCNSIQNTTSAIAGMTYLGKVHLVDMPFTGTAEVIVRIMTNAKVIILEMFSGDVACNHWYAMYYDNAMHTGDSTCPWQGIMSVNGDYTRGYTPTTDYQAASKKYVDDSVKIDTINFNGTDLVPVNKKVTIEETDPEFIAWKNGKTITAGENTSGTEGCIAIGLGAKTEDWGTAVGVNSFARCGLALGPDAKAGTSGDAENLAAIAIGRYSQAPKKNSIAIGGNDPTHTAKAEAEGAVQIGIGTNSDANTLQFRNTKIVNSSGQIPSASLDVDIAQLIQQAISNIIYEDSSGGHIKISNNYTLNITPTGTITATYPTV